MSAIVTNARNRIAYNVVRSLGKRGIATYAADFVPRSMSFASRYAKGHFLYPSPFRQPEHFIQRLIDEIDRLRVDVLIPVFEETFLVAKHIQRFSGRVATVLPEYEKILVAHNKDKWEGVARQLGIPVPSGLGVDALRADSTLLKGLRYPVLIKPKQGGGAWGIREVASWVELNALLNCERQDGLAWERFFVQEKILGETHCVAMLLNRGKLRAKVAYRQLRDYPASGGQATARVSVRSPEAEAHLQMLLEMMNWHGVCQADFVVEAATRVPYLIDLNPRLWGSLAQSIASGVDLPYLIYQMAMEGDVDQVTRFKTGVVTRWVGGVLGGFFPHLYRASEKTSFAKEFFWPRTRAALYDDFSMSDPCPFFVWMADSLLKAIRHRSLRATSHDALDGTWE